MSDQAVQRPAGRSQVQLAIETFARGFAFTRSFTHPYLAEKVGPLWAMRDAPRTRGDCRREEWVAYDVPAKRVDALVKQKARGHYALCIMSADDSDSLTAQYKALGYRLGGTEPLMVHSLARIGRCSSPATIERVMDADLADRLAKAAGARQILPEHLVESAPLRQYAALIDQQVVGWVRSIVVGRATWCSNMFVLPKFRRRGIAKAMLYRMLRDDRAEGAKSAALLASHTGALLYSTVGYEQIGTLLLFTPQRR